MQGRGSGKVRDFALFGETTGETDEFGQAGCAWWTELTGRGGEGMVVKPLDYIARGRRGLAQPALKTRGREYLRIIYGPEYTEPANLERLRERGLGAKRSLALREFALGIEALERFVRDEPLRRVHECVFGLMVDRPQVSKDPWPATAWSRSPRTHTGPCWSCACVAL